MPDVMVAATRELKARFGYDGFRPGQDVVVRSILTGRDVLAVMPTGAGKSVCYQLPATVPGALVLVITPLRALMRDQVAHLTDLGIGAALIDSGLTARRRADVYASCETHGTSILYVAPERLDAPDFRDFCTHVTFGLVAVDEAHCVLQWGEDFRPDYLRIGEFVDSLPHRPVVAAFTATATPDQRGEIAASLRLHDPVEHVGGFDRPNIRFEAHNVRQRDRDGWIVRWARSHPGTGIVYCPTRRETEHVAKLLTGAGISAAAYHSTIGDTERRRVQDEWTDGRIRVVAATTAFGMGVDKADVRWVLNDGACSSIEEFYQEAGRAGRDGGPADSVMLWARRDFDTLVWRVRQLQEHGADRRTVDAAWQRLRDMREYCSSGRCLRRTILSYFGQDPGHDCHHCGACDATSTPGVPPRLPGERKRRRPRTDRTGTDRRTSGTPRPRKERETARRGGPRRRLTGTDIIRHTIARFVLQTGPVNEARAIAALRGSHSAAVRRLGLDGADDAGLLADVPDTDIRHAIRQLEDMDAIRRRDGLLMAGDLIDQIAGRDDGR